MTLTFERYSDAELFAATARRRGWEARQRGESVFVREDEGEHELLRSLAERYSLRAIDGVPAGPVDVSDLRDRALAACEDGGRCQHRDGPDGWCDSCVAVHLTG